MVSPTKFAAQQFLQIEYTELDLLSIKAKFRVENSILLPDTKLQDLQRFFVSAGVITFCILAAYVSLVFILITLSFPSGFVVGGDNSLLYFVDPELFIREFVSRSNFNNELGGVGRPFPQAYMLPYFELLLWIKELGFHTQHFLLGLSIVAIPIYIVTHFQLSPRQLLLTLCICHPPILKNIFDHLSLSGLSLPVFVLFSLSVICLVEKRYILWATIVALVCWFCPMTLLTVNYLLPLWIFGFAVSKVRRTYAVNTAIILGASLLVNYQLVVEMYTALITPAGYILSEADLKQNMFQRGDLTGFVSAFFGGFPSWGYREPTRGLALVLLFLNVFALVACFILSKRKPHEALIVHVTLCMCTSAWFFVDLSSLFFEISNFFPAITMWKNSFDKFAFACGLSFVNLVVSCFAQKRRY